jgi:hypothetical protein
VLDGPTEEKERGSGVDEETMKLGLLVETAETNQKLAAALLEKLRQHTQGLDSVVRDQVRRTLLEELQGVHAESERAVEALRRVQRAANLRIAFWSVGLTAMCVAASVAVAWWWLPSPSEIQGLREQRDELVAGVERLNKLGARADLQHCGEERRLCVRVDLKAGRFGQHSDYYVIKGY